MRCKYFSISLYALVVTLTATAQGKEDTRLPLFKIRQVYQKINKDSSYRVVTLDDPEIFLGPGQAPDGGAELKGYFKKDTIYKITTWFGLSNRVLKTEYYFDNSSLVFVYTLEEKYVSKNNQGELDPTKLTRGFTGRYYFKDGRLIDTLLSDKAHEKSKKEDAALLLSDSKKYASLLRTRQTNIQ